MPTRNLPIFFELCTETLEGARLGQIAGVDRLELCSRLSIGGVTPDSQLLEATLQAVQVPVRVLIRPRGGDFLYSTVEFAEMRRQVRQFRNSGAEGIVTGILLPDGNIDIGRTRELVELARPMFTTFHRAFDESIHLDAALEDVIATGADCLLTSGGQPNILAGSAQLAMLHRQAAGRITILAGGGLTLSNLPRIVSETGCTAFHGSLVRKPIGSSSGFASDLVASPSQGLPVIPRIEDIQAAMQTLRMLRDKLPEAREPHQSC